MKKRTTFFLLVLSLVFFDATALFNSSWSNISERQLILSKMEALYYQKDFQAFHDSVQVFLQQVNMKISPELKFKFAYASFHNGEFKQAAELFDQLVQEKYLLPYSRFFQIKSLWQYDTLQVRSLSSQFLRAYPKSSLADSLLIPLAQSYWNQKDFKNARIYFQRAARLKLSAVKKVQFKIAAAQCLYQSGKTNQAMEEFLKIIKRYPSYRATEQLTDWLEQRHPDWYKENFLKIYSVLRANRRLEESRVKLEQWIREKIDSTKLDKARFLLLVNYYSQGRYRTALYGFDRLYRTIKDRKLRAKCLLYKARTQLAIGHERQGIQTYLEFAKQFPNNSMAPEVVWKSALSYEMHGKLSKALELYRRLHSQWPRNSLGKEAYFRQGFTLFRLGHYQAAELIFNRIRFSRLKDTWKNRAQYWASLCREMIGDTLTAHRLRRDLGREMWDDYYTLKSYLLEKSYLDSTLELVQELKNVRNPLHYYGKGFQRHLSEFERVFLLNDLLGAEYARLELATIKIDPKNLQEWIAVAEAYKRLKLFGRAYHTYDQINKRFYRNLSYSEKFFILKERFPFYYDGIVTHYCRRYGLEKELVLGLIKQESAFNKNAHSYANAYGLMQLIPATARDMARLAQLRHFTLQKLFDPEVNIHLGTLYLKQLQRRYQGDKLRMLSAYNAGPHRVDRWNKIPFSEQDDFLVENIEFSQTRTYVRHVLKNYWAYKLLYNNFQVDEQKLLAEEKWLLKTLPDQRLAFHELNKKKNFEISGIENFQIDD